MSQPVIKIDGLGKKYILGQRQDGVSQYTALRDIIAVRANALKNRVLHPLTTRVRQPREEFWALKDISLEIHQGDRVGIVGRNGAGKSTLLKILSRITTPTHGSIRIKGRVASLLEVGTGFHPELTGRENIYLNGAVLGMMKSDIKRKFDEIVAFAEVEKFLDTPVKRYSSGMYVRLAFSVAAHLEPDILIVDEVLAVGDAAFQKKCLGKMGEVSESEGRTVLFVSHNMTAIRALCNSGVYLENGLTKGINSIEETLKSYALNTNANYSDFELPLKKDEVTIHDFYVTQDDFRVLEYDSARVIDIQIDFEVDRDLTVFRMGVFLRSSFGECIFRSLLADWDPSMETIKKGRYLCKGKIPPNFVAQGNYSLELHSSRFGIKDYGFGDLLKIPMLFKFPSNFNMAHIDEKPFGSVMVNSAWTLEAM